MHMHVTFNGREVTNPMLRVLTVIAMFVLLLVVIGLSGLAVFWLWQWFGWYFPLTLVLLHVVLRLSGRNCLIYMKGATLNIKFGSEAFKRRSY